VNINDFFKISDPRVDNIGGFPLHPEWWSRGYEYPWALSFARPGEIIADMGCGWSPRPLKDVLAKIAGQVYAIDKDKRVLQLPVHDNLCLVQADFAKQPPDTTRLFADGYFDKIFCISVLEDLNDMVPAALREFARLIKPGGKIIMTFDVKYNLDAPAGPYPGVNLPEFMVDNIFSGDLGLRFHGDVFTDKSNAVVHPNWNLCCYHCVLTRRRNV